MLRMDIKYTFAKKVFMLKAKTLSAKSFFEKGSKTVIEKSRKELLISIAEELTRLIKERGEININFICTHNSRRSQIAQTWGFFAGHFFQLPINSFSGGTEATAFFRNSVKTLKEVGFNFHVKDFSHQNPAYEVSEESINRKFIAFSKTYDDPINESPFVAITTCDHADENCPFIPEAIQRFHLPYIDPKHADGTEKQDQAYMFTNKTIANEIYFLFKTVKTELNS